VETRRNHIAKVDVEGSKSLRSISKSESSESSLTVSPERALRVAQPVVELGV